MSYKALLETAVENEAGQRVRLLLPVDLPELTTRLRLLAQPPSLFYVRWGKTDFLTIHSDAMGADVLQFQLMEGAPMRMSNGGTAFATVDAFEQDKVCEKVGVDSGKANELFSLQVELSSQLTENCGDPAVIGGCAIQTGMRNLTQISKQKANVVDVNNLFLFHAVADQPEDFQGMQGDLMSLRKRRCG
jgi:hypothetical protein